MTNKKRLTVMVSAEKQLISEDIKRWIKNALIFTAPALAIFFAQMASGVEFKVAAGVAVLALYGLLADLFKKWRNQEVYGPES